MLKQFFILFLFLSYSFSWSQEMVDSLNNEAMSIYKQDPNSALKLLEQALDYARSKQDIQGIGKSKNNLGIVQRDLGQFEKAKSLSQEALDIVTDSLTTASAYNNIGVAMRSLGDYESSLQNYLLALGIYEKTSSKREQATVSNNIGMVYSYLGFVEKAKEYHNKAKVIFEELNNQKGLSEVYNNLAILFANEGELDISLEYFKYSLKIEEALEDQKGIAESANNVGAVFYYLTEIDSALYYFNRSVAIEKSLGNLSGLGASYNNIAQILLESKQPNTAKTYIDSAYYYAKKTKTIFDIKQALDSYVSYYELKDNPKEALNYLRAYINVNDSILNLETTSKVAELEIQYETEKKEKEILSQRANLAEKELALNKKNYYIYGLISFAVVVGLLGYLLYNQQKLKNHQLRKENELKDALLKIETQNRLQEQRLRISRDLHDNIGAQLTFIISSIDNLKYGFELPEKLNYKLETISEFTTATIYELRDTIWAMNKDTISVEDFESRISNFIDKANVSNNHISFDFTHQMDDTVLFSSVTGMNLYRIMQEAVNNALKYSKANEIKVHLETSESLVKITIHDNGIGFDTLSTTSGNGLQNMKKRAQDINASFSLKSEPNKGTSIEVTLTHY